MNIYLSLCRSLSDSVCFIKISNIRTVAGTLLAFMRQFWLLLYTLTEGIFIVRRMLATRARRYRDSIRKVYNIFDVSMEVCFLVLFDCSF